MKAKDILIIDDDKDTLKFLEVALEREGYIIKAADKKDKILQAIEQKKYDLLIIDLILQDIEIDYVIGKYRNLNPKSEIILITGHPDLISSIELLSKQYISEYLIKPISSRKILEVVDRILNNNS